MSSGASSSLTPDANAMLSRQLEIILSVRKTIMILYPVQIVLHFLRAN